MSPLNPAIIPAAASVLQSGANLAFQGNMNRKNRRFARQERERAYQSELEFWRMNNEYNHPSAQMARLRESGLNPRMIYGSSGSGAVGTSTMADAPAQARWQGVAPQINGLNPVAMLDTYTNIEAKKAQTDNFREQNNILRKEGMLRDLGILKKTFDLGVDYETRQGIVNTVFANLGNTLKRTEALDVSMFKSMSEVRQNDMRIWNDVIRTNTGVLDSEMNRRLMKAGVNQREAQTKGQEFINRVNKAKADMYAMGITPSDSIFARLLVGIAKEVFPTAGNIGQLGKQAYEKGKVPGRKLHEWQKKNNPLWKWWNPSFQMMDMYLK